MPRWRLIPHDTQEGAENLAFDAWLLRRRFPFPVLRFYSWRSPCVSYGYFQKKPDLRNGLCAYRRITGGGVVFHDRDLAYSLTYPRGSGLPWSVRASYADIHRLLQRALGTLGVDVSQARKDEPGTFCFESPVQGDLLYKGRKVCGAAQRRMGNTLLHQGTILVDRLGVAPSALMEALLPAFQKRYAVTFETKRWERMFSS